MAACVCCRHAGATPHAQQLHHRACARAHSRRPTQPYYTVTPLHASATHKRHARRAAPMPAPQHTRAPRARAPRTRTRRWRCSLSWLRCCLLTRTCWRRTSRPRAAALGSVTRSGTQSWEGWVAGAGRGGVGAWRHEGMAAWRRGGAGPAWQEPPVGAAPTCVHARTRSH